MPKKLTFSSQELIDAAKNGDARKIKTYLKTVGNPNLIMPGGKTLVHIAAEHNQIDVLQVLLAEKKIDINHLDSQKQTALQTAITNKNLEAVEILLAHKAALTNEKPEDLRELFLAAAKAGKTKIITSIAETAKSSNPETIFCLTSDGVFLIDILISQLAETKDEESAANLRSAIKTLYHLMIQDEEKYTKALQERSDKKSILAKIIDSGDLELFKEMTATVPHRLRLSLLHSIKVNNFKFVEFFVEEKNDEALATFFNKDGRKFSNFELDALNIAIQNPNTSPEIVKLLADKNRQLMSSLLQDSKISQRNVFDYEIKLHESLIKSGRIDLIDIVITRESGITKSEEEFRQYQNFIAEILSSTDDKTSRKEKGRTVLDLALELGRPDVIKTLLGDNPTKKEIDSIIFTTIFSKTIKDEDKEIILSFANDKKNPTDLPKTDDQQEKNKALLEFCVSNISNSFEQDFTCPISLQPLSKNPITMATPTAAHSVSGYTYSQIGRINPFTNEYYKNPITNEDIVGVFNDPAVRSFQIFFKQNLLDAKIIELYSKFYYGELTTESVANELLNLVSNVEKERQEQLRAAQGLQTLFLETPEPTSEGDLAMRRSIEQLLESEIEIFSKSAEGPYCLERFLNLFKEGSNPTVLVENFLNYIKQPPSTLSRITDPYIRIDGGEIIEKPQDLTGFVPHITLKKFFESHANLLTGIDRIANPPQAEIPLTDITPSQVEPASTAEIPPTDVAPSQAAPVSTMSRIINACSIS